MNPDDRNRRLRDLFDRGMDMPAAERPAFLDGACGDDPTLRADVARLLARQEPAQGFLEPPPARPAFDPRPRGRQIRCPHCHGPIEIDSAQPPREVNCPSCGSTFNLSEST